MKLRAHPRIPRAVLASVALVGLLTALAFVVGPGVSFSGAEDIDAEEVHPERPDSPLLSDATTGDLRYCQERDQTDLDYHCEAVMSQDPADLPAGAPTRIAVVPCGTTAGFGEVEGCGNLEEAELRQQAESWEAEMEAEERDPEASDR